VELGGVAEAILDAMDTCGGGAGGRYRLSEWDIGYSEALDAAVSRLHTGCTPTELAAAPPPTAAANATAGGGKSRVGAMPAGGQGGRGRLTPREAGEASRVIEAAALGLQAAAMELRQYELGSYHRVGVRSGDARVREQELIDRCHDVHRGVQRWRELLGEADAKGAAGGRLGEAPVLLSYLLRSGPHPGRQGS